MLVVEPLPCARGSDEAARGVPRRTCAGRAASLAAQPGYVGGDVGRNVDDPTSGCSRTRWENVGAYRRALSSYDVKLHAVPLLSRALDEPQRLRGRSSRATDLN